MKVETSVGLFLYIARDSVVAADAERAWMTFLGEFDSASFRLHVFDIATPRGLAAAEGDNIVAVPTMVVREPSGAFVSRLVGQIATSRDEARAVLLGAGLREAP